LLEECKPKYFFLENVKMKKEYEKVISKILKVEPIEINSALLSAQRRKRLYWTNIPNITQPKDKGLVLKDIMEDEVDEKHYRSEKCCIRIESKKYSLSNGNDINKKCRTLVAGDGMGGTKPFVKQNGRWRKLTPIECERLQTVDDNYTSIVSDSGRYKMLGNGWTVDVIAHIFKNINSKENPFKF
jgi:site-specific DNA-cytosine methylase